MSFSDIDQSAGAQEDSEGYVDIPDDSILDTESSDGAGILGEDHEDDDGDYDMKAAAAEKGDSEVSLKN